MTEIYATTRVRVRNQEDLERLGELLGQPNISVKTKSGEIHREVDFITKKPKLINE